MVVSSDCIKVAKIRQTVIARRVLSSIPRSTLCAIEMIRRVDVSIDRLSNRAGCLEMLNLFPREPQLEQKAFGMFRRLRGTCRRNWRMVKLYRTAHYPERRSTVAGFDLDDHIICQSLFVLGKIEQALYRRPLPLHRLEVLPPISHRFLGKCQCN